MLGSDPPRAQTANMHNVDIDTVELTLDVMKFAISRITNSEPPLGAPRTEGERKAIAGETVTPRKEWGKQETVARFCFINPDTSEQDIAEILNTISRPPDRSGAS